MFLRDKLLRIRIWMMFSVPKGSAWSVQICANWHANESIGIHMFRASGGAVARTRKLTQSK